MSRVSKNPILIPKDVDVKIESAEIMIKGPKGQLQQKFGNDLQVSVEDNSINIKTLQKTKHAHAMSGTIRSLIANMVHGVSIGFEKKLLLVGVGYRAQASGSSVTLNLGYSHVINYAIPTGINIETPTQTEILIKGIDKQKVGQTASELRSYRRPEPYKGKGVRYSDEIIKLKEAKKK